jgi:hypothetical protein
MLDAWSLVSAPQPYDVRLLMKCPGVKYGHRDTDEIERKRVRTSSSFAGRFSSESRPSNFAKGSKRWVATTRYLAHGQSRTGGGCAHGGCERETFHLIDQPECTH